MSIAIDVSELSVTFRPYVDARPTLRRSLGNLRHRETREVIALSDISFSITQGEAFGIVGKNGAGKSTLMRCMAGTLNPDHGKVSVSGRMSTLLQLGVGFNAELSGTRNIYLGGLVAGLSRSEVDDRFDDIVEYSELGEAIHRPVKTYSSGMFARLAFSVAMHLDPDILLLDEVLAVGDAGFKAKSLDSMKELLDRSGSIVFVSHNINTVARFCDRVAWLDGGRLVALGDARTVTEKYRTFVRGAGSPSVGQSLVEGDVEEGSYPEDTTWREEAILRVLSGDSVVEVAGELGVPPGRLRRWRDSFLQGGRDALADLISQARPEGGGDVSDDD